MLGGSLFSSGTNNPVEYLRTDNLTAALADPLAALTGGYHLAFVVGAVFAAAAALLGALLLRTGRQANPEQGAVGANVSDG